MNIRKTLMISLVALMLPAGGLSASSPASAAWLVRGSPLHVGYHHHHAYHGGYRALYVRNRRSGFFLNCAGTYGVPIC